MVVPVAAAAAPAVASWMGPAMAASLGLQGIGTIGGLFGQRKAAKEAKRAQEKQRKQEALQALIMAAYGQPPPTPQPVGALPQADYGGALGQLGQLGMQGVSAYQSAETSRSAREGQDIMTRLKQMEEEYWLKQGGWRPSGTGDFPDF